MGLITGKKDIRSAFEKAWTHKYLPGLLLYAERSKKIFWSNLMKQVSSIQQSHHYIMYMYIFTDDTSRQTTALASLVASMKCVATSKDCDPLCYLYQEYQVSSVYAVGMYLWIVYFAHCIHSSLYECPVFHGNPLLQSCDTPEQACTEVPVRNSPRIAAFVGEETKQYFVLLEQRVLCQVPSIQLALFITFSSYYIFHLDYPNQLKNVMYFL